MAAQDAKLVGCNLLQGVFVSLDATTDLTTSFRTHDNNLAHIVSPPNGALTLDGTLEPERLMIG
jgi:hypothetical protein